MQTDIEKDCKYHLQDDEIQMQEIRGISCHFFGVCVVFFISQTIATTYLADEFSTIDDMIRSNRRDKRPGAQG
jgi:hypothetical protein